MNLYELDKQFTYKLSQALSNGYAELVMHAGIVDGGVDYVYNYDPIPKRCKTFTEAMELADQEWERVKHILVKPTDLREYDPDYKCEA